MCRKTILTLILAVALVVAAAPASSATMETVLDERFDTLDASLWDVSYWYGATKQGGDTRLASGVLTLKPYRARTVSSVEATRPVVTRLPAHITFRARYPLATFRYAYFGLGTTRDPRSAFSYTTSGGILWNLSTTGRLTGYQQGEFVFAGTDRRQSIFYPTDGAVPVIPADTWLDGEVWLFADRFEARFNGRSYAGDCDVESLLGVNGSLRPGFLVSEDQGCGGMELHSVIVEQERGVVEARLDLDPDRLNASSNGRWVTAQILSTEEAYVASAAPATVRIAAVNGVPVSIPAQPKPTEVADLDGDGRADLMVKFDRAALAALLKAGANAVTVSGTLADGGVFEASAGVDCVKPRGTTAPKPRGKARGKGPRSRG